MIFACFLVSCAHYPRNPRLEKFDIHKGYRYPTPEETGKQDEIFIALAFSGGGTRAAAFSYGVLKGLNNTMVPGRPEMTVLDEVDVISSVSGGSFTSAYYGLFGKRIFEDFEGRFLNRNIQGELLKNALYPWNLVRLASPDFSRIDIAAELYNDTIFDNKTFQFLIDRGRHPYLAINATNMTTGARFTFTQSQFDLIGSNLADIPVARAVAASSAFPFLLTPISLINHKDPEGYRLPLDMELGLKDYDINDRRYFWAKNRTIYQKDKENHPYLHLMDGGLADNLGLRYIIDGYLRSSGFLFPRKGKIKHLLIIVVNAKTQPPQELDMREGPPGIKDVAYKTATVSLDNYGFETIQMTRDLLTADQKARQNLEACRRLIEKYCGKGDEIPVLGQQYQVYFIDIDFLKVKDPKLRERLLSLPTSFHLRPDEVRDLIDTGEKLIQESEEYQNFLSSLKTR